MVSGSSIGPVHPYKWTSASLCPFSSPGRCGSRSREFAWIGPWWTSEHPQPEPSQPDRPLLHRAGLRSAGTHLPGEPDPGAHATGQYAQPGHARPARDEVTKPGWVGPVRWTGESRSPPGKIINLKPIHFKHLWIDLYLPTVAVACMCYVDHTILRLMLHDRK